MEPPLHTFQIHPRTTLNRLHFLLYSISILLLFHHHTTTPSSFLLLFADVFLAFMWLLCQGLRWRTLRRREFPERLSHVTAGKGFPALDVFVCTADPYKEPPVRSASTALSALAFDYPSDRLSVYVSDDGCSELTLFAFLEAARFARHWFPFCRENGIMERSPEAYFQFSNGHGGAEELKMMFESFKERVDYAMGKGCVDHNLVNAMEEKEIFKKWKSFTCIDHPSVIQVLLESNKDKDISGNPLPNLIYISRENRPASPHNFKAGALNALGANYVGTGCFFSRRSFYSSPPVVMPFSDEVKLPGCLLSSEFVLLKAHEAASCRYELEHKEWGYQIGFKYGSLADDYYTGYRLHCQGWKSVFCNPDRPAFLGDAPNSLIDALNQRKRWFVGHYQVCFSRYCPLFYGSRKVSLIFGFCYMLYAIWASWCIPLTIYALLPQLALFYGKPLFPKASNPWFLLYTYLFLATYAQDLIDFMEVGGLINRWWSEQRMWMVKGVTASLFGTLDFILSQIGISAQGFTLTNKVRKGEENKLYDNGKFVFGIASPFFFSLGTIAIINLISFIYGFIEALRRVGGLDEMLILLLLSGFIVANSWPVYEAMFIRKDGGKMPGSVTKASIFLSSIFFYFGYLCYS